ncbi:MAG: DUF5928 domain-containing protein [Pseudomonadota bacterium]
MAKIAFLLLAHKDPDWVIEQAKTLTAHGDCVAIHYDARAKESDFSRIRSALSSNPNVALARRVKSGWGEYSLVQATLNIISAARARFKGVTHYFLISGDCFPTKSRGYFDRMLEDDRDIIETHDFFESEWIRTGLREDRLVYRHWFNERKYKRLFYASLDIQRYLRWRKSLPEGIQIRIGSQWWVLRAQTMNAVLGLLRERRDLKRFFKTTWIPDETFFQTLVAHVTPADQIRREPPTHLLFSDYGLPVVFHGDHEDLLRANDKPMARKISPHADGLRNRLLEIFRQRDSDRVEGGGNTNLYHYLTWRGRTGQRYRTRFWEDAIGQRRDAELLIVTARLWHIGKEVEAAIGEATGLRRMSYVFDEDTRIDLPLGNLETGLFKRGQHRRAMMNLIIDAANEQRLLIAIDPTRKDVIEDLAEMVGSARILNVERTLSDEYVEGHARRAGLISETSGEFERREAKRALLQELREANRELRHAFRGRIFRNDLNRPHEENVDDLCWFLNCPRETGERIARQAAEMVD